MNIFEIIKIAWKSIIVNKLRSLLTMLGVIIGVAAVIIMVSVSAGTEATIADQINGLGANLIFISAGFSGGDMGARGGGSDTMLVFDDAEAIADGISHISGVSVEQTTSQTIKYSDIALDSVTIVGTTIDYPSVREVPVGEGRFFNQTEVDRSAKVIVLGSGIAEELFGEADPVGQKVTVDTVKMTIVGVMEEKGTVSGTDYDSQVYIPISVVFDKFNFMRMGRVTGNPVGMIYVQAESADYIDEVILQIQLLMANRKDTTLDELTINVMTQQDIIETQESTTESFRSLLGWVAGVSLLVGGIGIMNIMLVSVTERTREIGIRQSIGATPNDIRWQFLTEAMILSLFGGLLGVLAGIGGSWLFGETGGMRTVILPESIVLAFTSAAVVGIIFGFIPANTAAKLDPIEALRHE